MTNHESRPVGPSSGGSFDPSVVDEGSGDELNLRDHLSILVRRRKLIVGSIILGVTLAILANAIMKPVYQASATVELNKASSGALDIGFGGSGLSSMAGGDDLDTDLKTQAQVLKSDALAMTVIEDLNLSAQAPFMDAKHPPVDLSVEANVNPEDRGRLTSIFQSHLRVDSVAGTRLIKVSFRSRDPKQAAVVANAIISSYKKLYLQSHYAAVSEASDWMTKQLSNLKANVEASEKQVTDFEKANGILTIPSETSVPGGQDGGQIHSPVIQKLDDLNNQLTSAETDRIQKEAIYRLASTGNPNVILGMVSSSLGQRSSILSRGGGAQGAQGLETLEARRSDLQVQLAQERAIYGPNNRHLKDMETQLSVIEGQVQDDMKKIVDRAGADLKVAEQTETAIRARFNGAQLEASKLNEKNVQLSILSQESFSRKKLYEDLYTKLQEAGVSAGVKATNITVVDPAFAPSTPVLPKRTPFIAAGILIGAFLGLGAAYGAEAIDTSVVSLPDIEEITGSAVIAVIPDFKRLPSNSKSRGDKSPSNEIEAGQSQAWILAHPKSIAAEAFRALRTSVLLSRPGGTLKTLLVTSSVPAEGKSTVALNLAIAIAQNGKKTVLVEADMRRPTLKTALRGVVGDVGLSSVLSDLVSLDDAILSGVGTPNLDVLPAGPVPPLPAELLSSIQFSELLVELNSRYDFVLIDSPPALILTDAITIASKADAVVWIVRAGAATRPHLVRAAQQISRSRMPFIGFVLNGLDSRIDPYGYSYSYYGYDSKRYGAYYGEDKSSDS